LSWAEGFGTVIAMPTPRSRQAARFRARRRRAQQRVRRLAVLAFIGVLGVVTLLLTAFGSGPPPRQEPVVVETVTLTSSRPSGQILASIGNLRIQLPVADGAVTGIGFHGARDGSLELNPVGRQANEGLLLRLWRRIAGSPDDGPVWYQLSGGAGPGTQVLNVGAAPGTDVYAPVDGTVVSISAFVIDGKQLGARIDIRPTQAPSVMVSLTHLRTDRSLAVGSGLRKGSSKIGTVVDVAAVERQGLAKHARDGGNNVAIAVYPAVNALP
jgi:hypothetical protein